MEQLPGATIHSYYSRLAFRECQPKERKIIFNAMISSVKKRISIAENNELSAIVFCIMNILFFLLKTKLVNHKSMRCG